MIFRYFDSHFSMCLLTLTIYTTITTPTVTKTTVIIATTPPMMAGLSDSELDAGSESERV